jgi:hypothetical protein
MADAPPSGVTRRQFLVAGAAGAAAVWAAPRLGWWSRADALTLGLPAAPTATPRLGQLPFSDDFDQEFPGQLLTGWSVTRPARLAGTTQSGLPCPANKRFDSTGFLSGHGMVVVMDGAFGATTGPGRIESVHAFALSAGRYTLSFQVAGSHHGSDPLPGTLTSSLPGCGAAMSVGCAAAEGFRRYRLTCLVTEVAVTTIVFESNDAPGQAGLVLDDISLSADQS